MFVPSVHRHTLTNMEPSTCVHPIYMVRSSSCQTKLRFIQYSDPYQIITQGERATRCDKTVNIKEAVAIVRITFLLINHIHRVQIILTVATHGHIWLVSSK